MGYRGLSSSMVRPTPLTAALAGLTVNKEKSRSVVQTIADQDVFVVEIDTAFDSPDGTRIVSLLKIFRMRDGEIVLLREYFSPDLMT